MGHSVEGTLAIGDFRPRLYACIGRRADALIELTDAILTSSPIVSPVHLSLAPAHRRGWGSLYAGVSKGELDAAAIGGLLASHNLDPGGTPVYAVDVSPWPRCDAEASPGRGYLYHPSRHSAGQPIVAGWAYQLVARLGFKRDSWATPADVRRVDPEKEANDVAAEQVLNLVARLPEQGTAPLFVFDAGHDPVRLQRKLEGQPVQLLARLHSGRIFYSEPNASHKRPVGRPFRHGEVLVQGSEHLDPTDGEAPGPQRGLRRGARQGLEGVAPETRRAKERYGSESAAVDEGTVVLVEVETAAQRRASTTAQGTLALVAWQTRRTLTCCGRRTAAVSTSSFSSGS